MLKKNYIIKIIKIYQDYQDFYFTLLKVRCAALQKKSLLFIYFLHENRVIILKTFRRRFFKLEESYQRRDLKILNEYETFNLQIS